MKNRITLTAIASLTLLPLLWSCATGGDKKGGDEKVSKNDDGGGKSESHDDGGAKASASRVTLTNSLSNNPLTSQTVSSNKAESLIAKFDGKSKGALEGRISAERLARKGLGPTFATAKRLAQVEMEKNPSKSIEDDVELELALAAITSKNYSMAEYYIQDILASKSAPARVRAGAHNALGVIALRDDRVPEAVLYFREALKLVGNYKPALLNLGFAALKGGDLDTAKKALGDLQSDWFVQYGLITVARIEGNEGRAGELCDKVLSKEPNHKAALFNCSLLEYQNKRNFNKAKALAEKAAKAPHGEPSWDDKAFGLSNDIDFAEAEVKHEEQEKKAAQAQQKKSEQEKQQQQQQKPQQQGTQSQPVNNPPAGGQ